MSSVKGRTSSCALPSAVRGLRKVRITTPAKVPELGKKKKIITHAEP
jgi:hypothetical protein